MTEHQAKRAAFFADIKTQAIFSEHGPKPLFLVDDIHLKVILGGLDAGQEIPAHPESQALYHFLQGTGTMSVEGDVFPIAPGATVIAPAGAKRGMQAVTRIVFLAAKFGT